MRVVVWNVRSLRDGGAAVARTLAGLAPDLVVLQEAPRLLGWRTSRALLARRSGLHPASRGRAAGNLLLVRPGVEVRSTRTVLLPRRPGLHRRAVVLADVVVDGQPLVLAGTHLDLDPEARRDSAARVRALLPPGPCVLGADVNEEPGAPAWHGARRRARRRRAPGRPSRRRAPAAASTPC